MYPNGASYLHMKHAHDMQNADTEYPFCWLEARHSSWLLAFFAIKLIHELSCIYQTYIIHNTCKALDLQIKYTEIDLFFSIYTIRCIRMQWHSLALYFSQCFAIDIVMFEALPSFFSTTFSG